MHKFPHTPDRVVRLIVHAVRFRSATPSVTQLGILGTSIAYPGAMASKKTTRPGVRTMVITAHGQAGAEKNRRDPDTLLSRARQDADRLSDEVRRLRTAFDTYVEQTSKELRASQHEIERLSRRVHQLEQLARPRLQIDTQARLPAPSVKSLFTFLGRPTAPSLS